jgi:hypothetical protein
MSGESQSIAQGGVQKMVGYWDDELFDATRNGELIEVLTALENGADPRIADNEGHIPLEYAKGNEVRSLLESALRNSYSEVPREPRMQGNEATRVDNGDIEKRKSNENE